MYTTTYIPHTHILFANGIKSESNGSIITNQYTTRDKNRTVKTSFNKKSFFLIYLTNIDYKEKEIYTMQKLSLLITEQLILSGHINSESKESYVYIYDFLFENIKYDATILLIGLIIHQFIPSLIFIVFFNILRNLSGGYHAKNRLSCNIISYFTYISFVAGIFFLSHLNINLLLLIFLLCSCFITIIGPIGNTKKIFNNIQRKKNQKKITLILLIMILLFIPLFYFKNILYCYTLTYCVMVISISLLIEVCITSSDIN